MEVDIYDFDKTAVPYDSAMKYWGYCMLHNPWILILLPLQIVWGLLMYSKLLPIHIFKKVCFCFVSMINNQRNVVKFWDKHEKDIYDWIKPNQRARTSVLISASPDFVIEEIAKRLNMDYCISTVYNRYGIMEGKISRRAEKVVRFRELLPDAVVKDVYSDNVKGDRYIFDLGERRFLAKRGKLTELPNHTALQDASQTDTIKA